MRSQVTKLFPRELKHEVGGEALQVPPDRLIQRLHSDPVEPREVGIQQDPMAAHDDNARIDGVSGCPVTCHVSKINAEHLPGLTATASAPARRKLLYLSQARTLQDLLVPPRNRLEALKGDRRGQHSIRVNDQWRICFRWAGGHA